jgi:hypothetical protein
MRPPGVSAWLGFAALAACGSEAPDDMPDLVHDVQIARIGSAHDALGASSIATLDPHTMNDAEIRKVLGEGSFCAFRYVSDGKPVLAWKAPAQADARAVVKLNGMLVELAASDDADGVHFASAPVRLTASSAGSFELDGANAQRPRPAELLFEIDQQLRVGYEGYSVCST